MTNDHADEAAASKDKLLWRRNPDDAFSPSIHVTEHGAIGMNVGGLVIVMPVEKWHELANHQARMEILRLSEELRIADEALSPGKPLCSTPPPSSPKDGK